MTAIQQAKADISATSPQQVYYKATKIIAITQPLHCALSPARQTCGPGYRTMFYVCTFRFFLLNWAKLSQDLLDRFSREAFAEYCQSKPVFFPIPQWTLPWQPILGEIREMSFIQHPGILKRSWIWQYGLAALWRKWSLYIVYKYGELWSRDWGVRNLYFWNDTREAAYLTEYLNNYWTDLHQRFSFGRCMYGNYKRT